MSIWSTINGTVSVHKSSHISLKYIVNQYFDEVSLSESKEDRGDRWYYQVIVHFCADSADASSRVEKFIKHIKNLDKTAVVDVNANIRWLA